MNREAILWIVCIIILAGLSVKLQVDAREFQCEKCTVTLYNEVPYSGNPFKFGTYKVEDLFNEYYLEGHCALNWDPTQGYTING